MNYLKKRKIFYTKKSTRTTGANDTKAIIMNQLKKRKIFYTKKLGAPRRAFGCVCVCVCVHTLTIRASARFWASIFSCCFRCLPVPTAGPPHTPARFRDLFIYFSPTSARAGAVRAVMAIPYTGLFIAG